MLFKEPHYEAQLKASPIRLQEIAWAFDKYSNEAMCVDPVATRLWDLVPGESGVHPLRRAIDFRCEVINGKPRSVFLYTAKEVSTLVNYINKSFPRNDNKLVAIYHSFLDGPYHFHLQIPFDWLTIEEKKHELARFL